APDWMKNLRSVPTAAEADQLTSVMTKTMPDGIVKGNASSLPSRCWRRKSVHKGPENLLHRRPTKFATGWPMCVSTGAEPPAPVGLLGHASSATSRNAKVNARSTLLLIWLMRAFHLGANSNHPQEQIR